MNQSLLGKKLWTWIGLLTILITLAACGSPTSPRGSGEDGEMPDTVSCEVYYRPAAGAALEGTNLALSTAGDQGSLEFEDMGFEATFLSDAGEGQSLSIVVTDSTAGAELTRGLYQFDSQQGLANQFVGGHGFTGLAYVYHPSSTSELQYFCAAGPWRRLLSD
jgi:hypothetical protein